MKVFDKKCMMIHIYSKKFVIAVRKSGRLRKTGKGLTTPESEFRGGLRGWQTTAVVDVFFRGATPGVEPSLVKGRARAKGEAVWRSPRGKYRSANWNSVQQPSLIYVWNRSLRTLYGPPSSRCIRLLRFVPFVSTSEFVRYSYVATVNDERRPSLCLLTLARRGNFTEKSESHGRAFHHNATKP